MDHPLAKMDDETPVIVARKSGSCPAISSLPDTLLPSVFKVNKCPTAIDLSGLRHMKTSISENSIAGALIDFNGEELDDHVTAVFSWPYGGQEVYLIEHENGNRKIKMVKSSGCFTTIQELPKDIFKYQFLVDGVLQHSPEQPTISTPDGIVNVLDLRNVVATNYTVPRQVDEMTSGTFGNAFPGPNYLSIEPPLFPEILSYRSPDFDNPSRFGSDIHTLSNHIYRDTKSVDFLGPRYTTYITIYRWTDDTIDESCAPRRITLMYITWNPLEYGSSEESETFGCSQWLKHDD
ncbi:hypothetical protein BEWA_031060 [Theileria equi strain WA]|uniref:AMP-activated protein kinase glycogen-binding domain-containing protein n=1 Tax=Theileria equi strain WA TaxID=1537102 RepID=L0AYB9_THEEQ|nr:hypothetical protein BEWA_031060 [Theileria equi strain WA]AFZ80253.1 hypothetical protein BEWA_031060 [Theileria equi strain WA]|eukprot:XP_004829919.1 hypothetical protein BEWA_031060 [Theileria equi strain WA]